jgi:predicted N-acetyltransferase YhbS
VSKVAARPQIDIRPMRETDLGAVLEVTNAAFAGLIERTTGHKPDGPMFASNLGTYRLSLDPPGCLVAVNGADVVGANFSVLRGTLGWFGPLAVRPDAQGQGIAQRLVTECLRSADERGVRLMGRETIADSAQHIHLYQKLGFHPSWTGMNYRYELRGEQMPDGVELDGAVPNLDYVYPGYDAHLDARATRSAQAGVTLTCGDGVAVCHLIGTLWADTDIAYVPLVAAPDRETFDLLVRAVQAVARDHGKLRVVTQVPGSAWATQEALHQLGYQPGGAALRMKRGESLDYDAGDFYYCDDWH